MLENDSLGQAASQPRLGNHDVARRGGDRKCPQSSATRDAIGHVQCDTRKVEHVVPELGRKRAHKEERVKHRPDRERGVVPWTWQHGQRPVEGDLVRERLRRMVLGRSQALDHLRTHEAFERRRVIDLAVRQHETDRVEASGSAGVLRKEEQARGL